MICLRSPTSQCLGTQTQPPDPPAPQVLFQQAMDHVCRIARVLSTPGGSALLVGVGGSGKQSLARLAASILGCEVVQVSVSAGYDVPEFKAVRPRACLLFFFQFVQPLQHEFIGRQSLHALAADATQSSVLPYAVRVARLCRPCCRSLPPSPPCHPGPAEPVRAGGGEEPAHRLPPHRLPDREGELPHLCQRPAGHGAGRGPGVARGPRHLLQLGGYSGWVAWAVCAVVFSHCSMGAAGLDRVVGPLFRLCFPASGSGPWLEHTSVSRSRPQHLLNHGDHMPTDPMLTGPMPTDPMPTHPPPPGAGRGEGRGAGGLARGVLGLFPRPPPPQPTPRTLLLPRGRPAPPPGARVPCTRGRHGLRLVPPLAARGARVGCACCGGGGVVTVRPNRQLA